MRRWITDVEKCYVFSRLRAEYCHICVDVCPYVHKANGDPVKKAMSKRYMAARKRAGYKSPTSFAGVEQGSARRKGTPTAPSSLCLDGTEERVMARKGKRAPEPEPPKTQDEKLDEALGDTFPASDPPAMTDPHWHLGSGKKEEPEPVKPGQPHAGSAGS